MRLRFFALVAMLAFVGAAVAVAEEPPALPDYAKGPFAQVMQFTETIEGHEDWGVCTVTVYATSASRGPKEQAVYVAADKDGNNKAAVWYIINDTGDDYSVIHRYQFQDGKWKYEKQVK